MTGFVLSAMQALPTPALLIDEEAVRKNCEGMLQKARKSGVELRPHVKTHKCREIARMQVGGDKSIGIVASTLPEVRFMAADGFTDITYGVPVSESKLKPLLSICSEYPATRVSIFVDSAEIVDAIEQLGVDPSAAPEVAERKDTMFGCFLKIDVGYHRAGVDVVKNEQAGVALARRLHESRALEFRGIYSHSGNAYGADSISEAKVESRVKFSKEK